MRLVGPLRWLKAVVQTTRPRQWPKNLLVFAAPLAGDTFGRAFGFWYALVAAVAFIAASSAVYLVNDVVDAERDRAHPYKKFRPVAAGGLAVPHAVALAVFLVLVALGAGLVIGEPLLAAAIAAYLVISFLYSAGLKHVPVVELACVASGFVLRVVGGAAATHVPPSGWFLLVCSLGALMVAIAKRYTELTVLGADAATHRPAMRGYTAPALRLAQRAVSTIMIVSYLLWAARSRSPDADLAPGQLDRAGRGAAQVRPPDGAGDQQAGRGPDRARPGHGGLRVRLAGAVRARALARPRRSRECLRISAGPAGSCCLAAPARSAWPSCPRCARRGHRGAAGRPGRAAAHRGRQGTALTSLRSRSTPRAGHPPGRHRPGLRRRSGRPGDRGDRRAHRAGRRRPEPTLAAQMIDTNFTSHVTTLLAAAARMRAQGNGTIVVLSSVAAIRPRKANYVYGAAKAGLDAFARGLADALDGTGVRVLLVRPGFVTRG